MVLGLHCNQATDLQHLPHLALHYTTEATHFAGKHSCSALRSHEACVRRHASGTAGTSAGRLRSRAPHLWRARQATTSSLIISHHTEPDFSMPPITAVECTKHAQ